MPLAWGVFIRDGVGDFGADSALSTSNAEGCLAAGFEFCGVADIIKIGLTRWISRLPPDIEWY